MGDAFTHLAKDQRREENINRYLRGLIALLENDLPIEELEKLAKKASGGGYGFFSGPVDFYSNDFGEEIKKLKSGNKKIWMKLIFKLWKTDYLSYLHYLSPWKKDTLVYVDYGYGFLKTFDTSPDTGKVSVGEVEEMIRKKDWIINDCDKYLIIISEEKQKVHWMENTRGFGFGGGMVKRLKRPRKKSEWTGDGTVEEKKKFFT